MSSTILSCQDDCAKKLQALLNEVSRQRKHRPERPPSASSSFFSASNKTSCAVLRTTITGNSQSAWSFCASFSVAPKGRENRASYFLLCFCIAKIQPPPQPPAQAKTKAKAAWNRKFPHPAQKIIKSRNIFLDNRPVLCYSIWAFRKCTANALRIRTTSPNAEHIAG